ncbi:hypothetical protein HIM_04738 [Hirsutella minnesotensis 3608]|uniref:Beta-galactosidase n=1 Tax=Hirsutella minnesotensis 3608 TaxID=1043627 RepID=A0A0F8A5U0_9HYPO|nr:hypothetical protein HIM_04738 [Hirsutella minnesotensis 3608]
MKIFQVLAAAALASPVCRAFTVTGPGGHPLSAIHAPDGRALLQDLVTWDNHSLMIRGERAMMFSGEFHPFRLPVPSLYLDVLQKVKALGFNMVSFYVDWALLEGTQGRFRADGVFSLEPFFDAAKQAGVYLLARPGPYINAEVSGGGFPGWLQRIKGVLRTDAGDFLQTTDSYMANICAIIAKHQITRGGPVVLFQPENEYSSGHKIPFPNGKYFQYVIDQARKAGIVVPMINNDAGPTGYYAPGSGVGAVDIYGHDSYPLGFNCGNPSQWPSDGFPTNFRQLHMAQSPVTPFSLVEFQGGSFDPWGGYGPEQCAALVNHEFERVFYKNNYAAGVSIFNIYMIFGGTNWGNLGHPGGYTSYDYGACIRENRVVDREKYSELKLQAEFFKVSPGYLVAVPGAATTGVYSDDARVTITPLLGRNGTGSFFVVRHTDYARTAPASYPVGRHVLLYSTAEVFTWKQFADSTVLVVYGGANETHEFALADKGQQVRQREGDGFTWQVTDDSALVVKWETTPGRQVIQIDDLIIHMLDRNQAYNYWVPVLSTDGNAYGSSLVNPEAIIVNGGYLVRSASVQGSTLSLRADFNTSTTLEIIGVPKGVTQLLLNGCPVRHARTPLGDWLVQPAIKIPKLAVPDLKSLEWRRVDSLPEIRPGYDDSAWPLADHKTSNNSKVPLQTPVSLYGADYGFNTGTLVFRGHFASRGSDLRLRLRTAGGSAFASSVWLDDTFVGSFANSAAAAAEDNSTYALPAASPRGTRHVLTVVVDTTGLDENWRSGFDNMKAPRGILDYALTAADGSLVPVGPWKVTGNLGGEDYADVFRGPLNEGGLFFERQGFHLPRPPVERFQPGSPFDGIGAAGVAFFVAPLALDYPADEYDIPLSFVFDKGLGDNSTAADYRAILYVNGFQYGKYASNIGPQTEFPVPEGILDYKGHNWIGLAVWALDKGGAKVPGLRLNMGTAVQTSRSKVQLVKGPRWHRREHAY